MTATKLKPDFKLTTDTPYLALGWLICPEGRVSSLNRCNPILTGEIWGVDYENFEEKLPRYNERYNDTALYCARTGLEWVSTRISILVFYINEYIFPKGVQVNTSFQKKFKV